MCVYDFRALLYVWNMHPYVETNKLYSNKLNAMPAGLSGENINILNI